jgi:serine/threonine-protein kinase
MPRVVAGDLVDGRYQVIRQLGTGAVAVVYEAIDRASGDCVALKIVRGSVARDRETLARLELEVEVQRRIEHPNVARILGSGTTAERAPYLVVELLRGRTLREAIHCRPRPDAARAVAWAGQILAGLDATHAAAVLHRDLKPANVILVPSGGAIERVVLIDFGFAALAGKGRRLTMIGEVVGSMAYVAPERLNGDVGDPRSDLYGVGVILYELLAGRRPFVPTDELDLVAMQLEADPPSLRAVAPDDAAAAIAPAVEEVVMRALAKRPDQRFASAAAMAEALARAAG